MTGPSTKRLPSSEPSLHDPALGVIQNIFGGGGTAQSNVGGRLGFTMPPELLSAFANFIGQPSPGQRTNAATLSMQGALGGAGNIPGFDVLNAAGPVFARNLAESVARTRASGPRFASGNDTQARLLETQGLQDFNLFSQNVLEQGRARQLQGILGYAQANQGQQGLQLQALMPILQALFGTGLSPGSTVGPSPLSQIAGAAAAIGSGAVAGGWQPFKKP